MASKADNLSKRERQIMDIIYKNEKATVAEVQAEIEDNISYSTVRSLLSILEKKGHIKHEIIGVKYIYIPRISKKNAISEAVKNLLETYCDNSVEQAVTALLEFDKAKLSDKDYEHINDIINKYQQEIKHE